MIEPWFKDEIREGIFRINIVNAKHFGVIVATYQEARDEVWPYLRGKCEKGITGARYSEPAMTVVTKGCSSITVYSADDLDCLRGVALDGYICSEAIVQSEYKEFMAQIKVEYDLTHDPSTLAKPVFGL